MKPANDNRAIALVLRGLVAMATIQSVVGVASAQFQKNRVSIEQNTNRAGANYAAFVASEMECRRRCMVESRCKAFTFTLTRRSPMCWLKDQPQTPSSDVRFVSGVKGGWPDLSIVTVNMVGHTTMPDAAVPGGADWQVRADRLADAIANLGPGRQPDIISMTEVEGWRWCSPGTGVTVGDYDMIDRLMARLSTTAAGNYRIAYMVGNRGTFGAFGQCRYFTGDAVLYNSDRLVNRNPEDAQRFPGQARYDDALQGFQLRKSLPLCRPGSARLPTARDLMDGAPQNDDCNQFVPSGPAWTWILAVPEMTSPVTLARFSFRHDRRSSFDFLTVHPMSGKEVMSRDTAINPFVTAITQPPFRLDPSFYPPIIVGDINSLRDAIDSIAGFVEVHGSTGDVMTVRRANLAAFPALNDYRIVERRVLPENLSNFFSDHIGLFVRLAWVNPADPNASRVLDLTDGTIVAENNGPIWIVAGGATFRIPDPDTHERVYGSRVSVALTPAALSGARQVPLDGTLLSDESGAIWFIAGGAKFRAPDRETIARLYPGARAVPLWNGAVAAIPDVPVAGTLLREESGPVFVVLNGRRDPFRRLSADDNVVILWSGALRQIPSRR